MKLWITFVDKMADETVDNFEISTGVFHVKRQKNSKMRPFYTENGG